MTEDGLIPRIFSKQIDSRKEYTWRLRDLEMDSLKLFTLEFLNCWVMHAPEVGRLLQAMRVDDVARADVKSVEKGNFKTTTF